MRVMVIVKASTSSEAGEMPSTELLEAMGKYNQELVQAGIMKAGDGLKPSREAKRIRFRGKERVVSDGPFTETKELIAGYWLWEVQSMEEAVEWVRRCPNPMIEDSDIDIRPIFEMSDFAEQDPLGKVAAQEDQLKSQIAQQNSNVTPYLFFGGRCEEALEFYKSALGATVGMSMRFNESPDPVPEGMLQAGFENKIMHAAFTVGKTTIMASDGCDEKSKFDGFRLAFAVACQDACHSAFNALAKGGTIDMPLMATFWSPLYGMVTDQFGVGWMVMVEPEV